MKEPAARPLALVIAAELVGAILVGAALGALFGIGIGYAFSYSNLGMGLLAVMLYAALAGFAVGAGLGTALAGRLLKRPGNLWLSIGLAVAVVAAAILAIGVFRINLGGLEGVAVAIAPLTLLLAVLGYNLRR